MVSWVEGLQPFQIREPLSIHLLLLNIDHFGIAWTQAAQFVAYRFRVALVVEKLLPRVISRPLAAAAVIPPGDRRISPGSKRDGIGHCALLTSEGCRYVHESRSAASAQSLASEAQKDTRRFGVGQVSERVISKTGVRFHPPGMPEKDCRGLKF